MTLTIRDVPGIAVGHATDAIGRTGCTVILADGGAVAGVDVRGSAPGTRETDLLRPTALVERIHALCLAGGSAYGLAAADVAIAKGKADKVDTAAFEKRVAGWKTGTM